MKENEQTTGYQRHRGERGWNPDAFKYLLKAVIFLFIAGFLFLVFLSLRKTFSVKELWLMWLLYVIVATLWIGTYYFLYWYSRKRAAEQSAIEHIRRKRLGKSVSLDENILK